MCDMQYDSTQHCTLYRIAILISQYAYKFGPKGNPFDFHT